MSGQTTKGVFVFGRLDEEKLTAVLRLGANTVFSPMTYQRMCGRPADWIAETVDYFWRVTKKSVLPLVQTEDKPGRIGAGEFEKSIEFALRPPSSGVVVFFLEDLLKDKEKVKVVERVFKGG